eukprot:7385974-Prymnesium_polylepis.2
MRRQCSTYRFLAMRQRFFFRAFVSKRVASECQNARQSVRPTAFKSLRRLRLIFVEREKPPRVPSFASCRFCTRSICSQCTPRSSPIARIILPSVASSGTRAVRMASKRK